MSVLNIVEELTYLDKSYASQTEYFEFMFQELREKRFVKDTFLQALQAREAIFPTGLPIPNVPIAIPHCEEENLEKSFISITRLKEPIHFVEMGTENRLLEVQMIFMLGLKAHDGDQVALLQKLIALFSDETCVEKMMQCSEKQALIDFVLEQTE